MHHRNSVRYALAGLFFSVAQGAPIVSSPVWAQGAPAAGAEKTADDYSREGREHALADRNEQALASFTNAWKLRTTYDIACNLGLVESSMHRYRDALEHLTYCQQNFPSVVARDEQMEATFILLGTTINEARAEVGAAYVTVTRDDGESAEGARVFVDGQPAAKIGAGGKVKHPFLQGGEIFVEPGSRRFSSSLKGCGDAEAVLAVSKEKTVNVSLELSCKKVRSKAAILLERQTG